MGRRELLTRARARTLALGVLISLVLITPAQARWLRAESEKFVVYSEGSEKMIREFATKLTNYDKVLRLFNPAARNKKPDTKVQVFLLRDVGALKHVSSRLPKYSLGFYTAMNEGVFAFAVKDSSLGDDAVLFHEYAHHFMLENFPTAYPAWFVEGWAEYFMTTEIDGAKIKVGGYSPARAYGIFNRTWLPMDQVLSQTTNETQPEKRDVYYAQAWLLMHYMRSDNTRAAQLDKASRAIAQGEAPVKAFQDATGLTMEQLTQALKKYNKLAAFGATLSDVSPPAMTVTEMPPSADALLLDNQRLILTSTGRVDANFLADVRRKAARYPGDAFAERTLARAEFVMGDVAAGEAVMKRRLDAKSDDAEDLLLSGRGQIFAGLRDPPQREARFRAARPLLAKAYALNQRDFRTLYAYGFSRSIEPGFPTDNDLAALLEARALAPAVTELSARAGLALLQKGRREDAATVLAVVINNPHAGAYGERMRAMLKAGKVGPVDLDPDASDGSEEPEPR
jgi:hypothetical protein